MDDSSTLTIESLAHGGDGVAHADGRASGLRPRRLPGRPRPRTRHGRARRATCSATVVEVARAVPRPRRRRRARTSASAAAASGSTSSYAAQLAREARAGRATPSRASATSTRRVAETVAVAGGVRVPQPDRAARRAETAAGTVVGYSALGSERLVPVDAVPAAPEAPREGARARSRGVLRYLAPRRARARRDAGRAARRRRTAATSPSTCGRRPGPFPRAARRRRRSPRPTRADLASTACSCASDPKRRDVAGVEVLVGPGRVARAPRRLRVRRLRPRRSSR